MNRLISNIFNKVASIVYFGFSLLDQSLINKNGGIFILCYHSVNNDGWKYGIDFETLKKQLTDLSKNFAPLTLEDVENYVNGKLKINKPSFVVTFDDGYQDIFKTKDLVK